MITKNLEAVLKAAYDEARKRRHEFVCVEHLLWVLLEDQHASEVIVNCGGDLDRVKRIVKLVGFVNSTPDFTDQPKVINGASDLMVEVFGEAGKHARSAVSAGSLPLGVAVEVECVAEIA